MQNLSFVMNQRAAKKPELASILWKQRRSSFKQSLRNLKKRSSASPLLAMNSEVDLKLLSRPAILFALTLPSSNSSTRFLMKNWRPKLSRSSNSAVSSRNPSRNSKVRSVSYSSKRAS